MPEKLDKLPKLEEDEAVELAEDVAAEGVAAVTAAVEAGEYWLPSLKSEKEESPDCGEEAELAAGEFPFLSLSLSLSLKVESI